MRRAGQPVADEDAAGARPAVEDAISEFLIQLEQEAPAHRDQYVERYKADLNLYVMPKGDDELQLAKEEGRVLWQPAWFYVDEITSALWEEEKLRLHKKNGGPLGWNSIKHLCNTLRHFLRFCVKERFIQSAPELLPPARKLILKEKRPRRALDTDERELLLRWLYKYTPTVIRKTGPQKSHPPGTAGRFFEVLHFTLLRRGEAWAATLRWMDRTARLFHIPPEHSKSGEEETIPLHRRAEQALLEQAKAAGLKPRRDLDVPIFGKVNVVPAFNWAMKKSKIDPHGVTAHHNARHTGATILAKKTKSREKLKKLTRHRSDQSIDPYLHVEAEDARELMDEL